MSPEKNVTAVAATNTGTAAYVSLANYTGPNFCATMVVILPEVCCYDLEFQVPLRKLGTEEVCAALLEEFTSLRMPGSNPGTAVYALVEAIRHDRLGAPRLL